MQRLSKIADFFVDRFHGAWPHWIDGTTGKCNLLHQDGGDLVETSFLVE
jgi:hypothetical protein